MMLEGCLNSGGYLVYRMHVSIDREEWHAEVFGGAMPPDSKRGGEP